MTYKAISSIFFSLSFTPIWVANASTLQDEALRFTILFENFGDILTRVIGILVALAFFYFIWSLVKYIKNSDSSTTRADLATTADWGLVGLFVLVSIWGIVYLLQALFIGKNANGISNVETFTTPGFRSNNGFLVPNKNTPNPANEFTHIDPADLRRNQERVAAQRAILEAEERAFQAGKQAFLNSLEQLQTVVRKTAIKKQNDALDLVQRMRPNSNDSEIEAIYRNLAYIEAQKNYETVRGNFTEERKRAGLRRDMLEQDLEAIERGIEAGRIAKPAGTSYLDYISSKIKDTNFKIRVGRRTSQEEVIASEINDEFEGVNPEELLRRQRRTRQVSVRGITTRARLNGSVTLLPEITEAESERILKKIGFLDFEDYDVSP